MLPPLPFKVKTNVSWPGEEEGDLGFIENEYIEVFSIVDDSWWSGKLRRNGAEGIFPKDYVTIIEEKLPHSSSSRSIAQQNTPIKEEFRSSKSNTPNFYGSRNSPKRITNDYDDDDDSLENSFDMTRSHGRKSYKPKKYDDDREREIEAFRILQQQQNYHIKKQYDQQRRMQQQDQYRRSVGVMPDGYHSLNSLPKKKRLSYIDRDHSFNEFHPVYHSHTVESFSPQTTPKKNLVYDIDDEDEEIAITKQKLELELQRIKQLEKRKKAQKSPPPVFHHENDSYVSEDLMLSKKNYQSKESLGRKLGRYVTDEDDDDDEVQELSTPPPPPPKRYMPEYDRSMDRIPFDADDFKYSADRAEEQRFRLSQLQQEELKRSLQSLQSDVLNLSELSATSAGSFMRHKYDKQMQFNESRLKGMSISEFNEDEPKADRSVMDSVFEDRRKPNIFQKILNKKKPENLLEQRFLKEEQMDWALLKTEMNRMNSLTTQDKQQRTRRIVREESNLIVKPLDYVSDINVNETIGDVEDDSQVVSDFKGVSFYKPDTFIAKYSTDCDFNDLISDISVKFNSSKVHQLRCVLLHLCKFRIIEELSKIMQLKPKLSEVLHKGEASIYQLNYLFKKILDALRIPAELVLGFWKKPNEFYHIEQYVVNHCWLSVLIEGKLYIMDIYSFKNGSVCNLRDTKGPNYNEYYFLTKPLSVVSTHIPSIIDLQHVVPPIDQTIAFYLPRVYSGFHKNGLKFRNFNNALTRMKDSEIFEVELDITPEVELFTLVKTSKVTTNELSLCQVYWSNNKRIVKIKALLPEKESIGVLQIFAGAKGLQKHFDNIHELAAVIPLYHTGVSKPGKFVPRFPTVQSQNNDLYIKLPQNNKIVAKNAYNFEILQHPSQGLNSGSGLMNQDFKIVIESPSGKYFKMTKDDSLPYGTYQTNIKCQEVGIYRGLVIGDSGNSWYVFAQWDCVAAPMAD